MSRSKSNKSFSSLANDQLACLMKSPEFKNAKEKQLQLIKVAQSNVGSPEYYQIDKYQVELKKDSVEQFDNTNLNDKLVQGKGTLTVTASERSP